MQKQLSIESRACASCHSEITDPGISIVRLKSEAAAQFLSLHVYYILQC